jgi:hypothetical protein
MIPPQEGRAIAVRAFLDNGGRSVARVAHGKEWAWQPSDIGASEWTLILDTETTIDAAQQMRFGAYQLRCGDNLEEAGLFYDTESLTDAERGLLMRYAENKGIRAMAVAEFVDATLYGVGYDLGATIVGFNLPFDISRLAIGHASARGRKMHGGFTFRLSRNRHWPAVQVKHLSQRAALIRFVAQRGKVAGRGMRRRGHRLATRRGYFLDVKTLAAALTSRSFSLATLAEFLDVPGRKQTVDEHGGSLTEAYLDYAMQDVQVTWECASALRRRYEDHGLKSTPAHRILSEAGLGKAYLKEMGVRPWREVQPDANPALIGTVMGTYYGGRSEVHIRRDVRQVAYCDFLSMYPTVCCLMGLWRFVVAEGVDHHDATDEVRALLASIALPGLRRPEAWGHLCVLVQVLPDCDLFPVRAKYGHDTHYTIGLNHLTSDTPMWFTLADCIAAVILGGKVPNMLRAMRFTPRRCQADLRSVAIAGNPAYRVDPRTNDLYRSLIELRAEVKNRSLGAEQGDRLRRDIEQQALKILANSTSYGIFVELNVERPTDPVTAGCHGPSSEPFLVRVQQVEEPGRYFHPLLATLITGAARLLLAITERLIIDQGLDWVFCDTDSMAIAKPPAMDQAAFNQHVAAVRDWFSPLNPYQGAVSRLPLLKLEDANYGLGGSESVHELAPLHCLAVSPKRYVLFNLDGAGRPLLRKASAHGLGHLRDPSKGTAWPADIPAPAAPLSAIGVDRWQYDVWYRIATSALYGHPEQVRLDDLPGIRGPAVSRYAATTPDLLRWFKGFNRGKPYREQVRPFGFLLAFQAKRPDGWEDVEGEAGPIRRRMRSAKALRHAPRAVAPFDRDPAKAARACFDRETGRQVSARQLKTYHQALVRYHLHPDPKALSADFTDRGVTGRRHIGATGILLIGKEANRWEEQFHLGADPEAQSEFGFTPDDQERMRDAIRRAAEAHGVHALARKARLSRQHLTEILSGRAPASRPVLMGLAAAATALATTGHATVDDTARLVEVVRERCDTMGIRAFARLSGLESGHLARLLAGSRRRPSPATILRLRKGLSAVDAADDAARKPAAAATKNVSRRSNPVDG